MARLPFEEDCNASIDKVLYRAHAEQLVQAARRVCPVLERDAEPYRCAAEGCLSCRLGEYHALCNGVAPAKAGVQWRSNETAETLGPRPRGDDGVL